MSKVEQTLTPAEILEWSKKDLVISLLGRYHGGQTTIAGKFEAGIERAAIEIYGARASDRFQIVCNFPVSITRHANDQQRRIGYITGVNDDGSFNMYILGSGVINTHPTHFVQTVGQIVIQNDLRILPPAMDYYFPEHASDFLPYLFNEHVRNGEMAYAYPNDSSSSISVNDAFLYTPTWVEYNISGSSILLANCVYTEGTRHNVGEIQLTNNTENTMQLGKPMEGYFWQQSQSGYFYGDKNIGGDLFDLLSSMSISIATSVANMPTSVAFTTLETTGAGGTVNTPIVSTYQPWNGFMAYHYIPYNLILTYDLNAAKNYVETGELPGDAFLYPFDVDNIPVNTDGGTGADDSDGTQDTVDTGDTTWEETDDQSPSAPGQNGQSLTNNNLYWLTSQQLKSFLDWFWDEATDVSDPSELFEKIQGLYENLSEAIVAVRYMPVRPEWIGGVSTDTKIIVGMLEKAEQCRVINKVVPDIQTIGSIDIRELAKDNKTWDGFLNYSPYCQMSLYLPFHGFIDLDADLIMNSKLTIKAAYDILTGTIQYFIYRTARGAENLNLVNTVVAKMATDIPISLQTKTQRDSAIFQNVSSAAGNLIGAGASLATGNPIGMVMSTANIAATQPTGAPLTLKGTISENGAYYDSALCAIYVKRPGINIPSNYDRKVGNPCNVAMKLSKVHGFVKCENPFISFSEVTSDNSLGFPPPKPTKDEIDTIYNALSEGVILP